MHHICKNVCTFARELQEATMRDSINIFVKILCVVLAFAGCTNHDCSKEAMALSEEVVNDGLSDIEHSVERVDSAEQAGLFTAVRANTIKAIIYANADRRRMASYYAEKAIAAEAGQAVTTSDDSILHCKALWILGDGAYADGEYADTTPADYLNRLRIQYAAQLLEKSDDPIGLIIEQSGITNRTTFARLFAAYYSMTPSEYRKIAHKQSCSSLPS